MKPKSKVALVTGSNKGLGFEIARQLAKRGMQVILTSRSESKGKEAAGKLRDEKLDVSFHALDVTSQKSVDALAAYVAKDFGHLDVLVNNAGIFIDEGWQSSGSASIQNSPIETIQETIDTNLYGPIRVTQALLPSLKKSQDARVINISSGMGQLSEMGGGYPAYRISKTALNAVTRIFSQELASSSVTVNSVCPGWVKTDMGGEGASLTPEQGADTVVWLATSPEKHTGGFYQEREKITW